MGNNTPCKIVERGTVHIKMHNGVIKTLYEVSRIPNLKKKLDEISECIELQK